MHIIYKSTRLEEELTNIEMVNRRYGSIVAMILVVRIEFLLSSPNLADPNLYKKPLLCHQLKGNRREELAVRVNPVYRIIFIPADPVVMRKPDNGINTRLVSTICITELSKHYD